MRLVFIGVQIQKCDAVHREKIFSIQTTDRFLESVNEYSTETNTPKCITKMIFRIEREHAKIS